MDRRKFLAWLGGSVAGTAAVAAGLDLDRILWTPGERTIFLPTPVALDPWPTVYSAEDYTLAVSAFGKDFLKPAIEGIARRIDAAILKQAWPEVYRQERPIPMQIRQPARWNAPGGIGG